MFDKFPLKKWHSRFDEFRGDKFILSINEGHTWKLTRGTVYAKQRRFGFPWFPKKIAWMRCYNPNTKSYVHMEDGFDDLYNDVVRFLENEVDPHYQRSDMAFMDDLRANRRRAKQRAYKFIGRMPK